ncbi:DUF6461 domain-containing protein [Cryptosporangium aurantiacum]|uniref:Uncharacterized protein n=1 Tax=Cryptosporangium aurantiacum TaxID=134849 RepID=A0A1M7RC93_9ACTN|nr:DUF6461 domain-containing protein [Cryptosporangium aurantiacum]SHN43759.1 hypothetical protein SAMN05443668_109328 [Cryptosporangium aurantiacum]
MIDVSDLVTDDFAESVASRMAQYVDSVPRKPAAELGRVGAPQDTERASPHARVRAIQARRASRRSRRPGPEPQPAPGQGRHSLRPGAEPQPVALAALRGQDPLVVERLLGALERSVADAPAGLPDLSAHLRPLPDGSHIAFLSSGRESAAYTAASLIDRLRPGVADLVLALARALAEHPAIQPHLRADPAVPPPATASSSADAASADAAAASSSAAYSAAADGEEAVAAQHGAAYLALSVATASAVITQADAPNLVEPAAAVVGLGLGTAATLLAEVPMPAAYAAALLERIRAEYVLPRHAYGSVRVADHRFALAEGGVPEGGVFEGSVPEGSVPEAADFSANGLVAVVDGGAVIRTGVPSGHVQIQLAVLAAAPSEVEPGWEDVVEVSWRAREGRASVVAAEPQLQQQTPPWPGDYRLRVHTRGRDEVDHHYESYRLVVWAAPAAPTIIHQRSDALGHRLRGEPEPVRPARPERAYRWIQRSALSTAATVTVTTGATVDEVLRAFGADPTRPEPMALLQHVADWVAVLDVGDAILAVEFNGYLGSREPILCAASAQGRAASMFWNVNAVTRLSFAEHGELLAGFEPWGDVPAEPAVAAALDGLDFAELGDREEKGLLAVERFTGRGLREEDLARVEEAGLGYRVSSR